MLTAFERYGTAVSNMHDRVKLAILVVLIGIVLLVWYGVLTQEQDMLTVAFLDVGQGDAIFIESPSGIQALIDGGPGASVVRQLSKEMPFFDRSIDVVIATHPDKDHIGGLIDVLEAYTIDTIMVSQAPNDTGIFEDFNIHVEGEQAEVVTARRGDVLDLGDGAYIRILFPDRNVAGGDTNAASIVTQLVYGDTEVLLTGDAPQSVENHIVALDGETLKSDILKAGHHGSRTSSSELFVGWVQPEYGVFSRGCDNRYGHPHVEVLQVMEQFEIEILDTCEEGSVVFESDGSNIYIK